MKFQTRIPENARESFIKKQQVEFFHSTNKEKKNVNTSVQRKSFNYDYGKIYNIHVFL